MGMADDVKEILIWLSNFELKFGRKIDALEKKIEDAQRTLEHVKRTVEYVDHKVKP